MEQQDLPEGSVVRVYWSDSASYPGWQYDMTKNFKPTKVVSVGYVVKATGDSLVLTTSITDEWGVMAPLIIPWTAIDLLEQQPTKLNR